MTWHADNKFAVTIAGGSIGGLSAGIALRSIGCDVNIYERLARSARNARPKRAMLTRGGLHTVQRRTLLALHGEKPRIRVHAHEDLARQMQTLAEFQTPC
jgi:2,6-dihydroxypyridine 3-monooxygenase